MALLIIFATAHQQVVEAVNSRKLTLIPPDIRANDFAALKGQETILSVYRVTNQSNVGNFLEFVRTLGLDKTTGVIIMTDESLPGLVDALGDQFSVNRFTPPAFGKNIQNALMAILTRSIRAYLSLSTRFQDMKYQQILRLPLRNFQAPEIADLRSLCKDMANKNNFSRELDPILARFRKRQHPKKASSRRRLYFVDDSDSHFELGHEVHARADDAIPPHNYMCILANTFRFGVAFDGARHFNVSRERDVLMTGNFYDCHNDSRSAGGTQHLNMFSNDFF